METEFKIGVITSTHGLKGEVKVFPTTSDTERFKTLKECYARGKDGDIPLTKKTCKYFKNMVILGFEEIPRIEEAETLKGLELYVSRENAIPLEEGEFYFADVMDSEVYDEEEKRLGTLTDVIETGANLVFEVKLTEGKTVLVPVIDEAVKEIDTEHKRVVIKMMKGLMD